MERLVSEDMGEQVFAEWERGLTFWFRPSRLFSSSNPAMCCSAVCIPLNAVQQFASRFRCVITRGSLCGARYHLHNLPSRLSIAPLFLQCRVGDLIQVSGQPVFHIPLHCMMQFASTTTEDVSVFSLSPLLKTERKTLDHLYSYFFSLHVCKLHRLTFPTHTLIPYQPLAGLPSTPCPDALLHT